MLLKLEAQEEELGAKISVLEGNIAEEKKSDSDEAKKVQEQLQQVREEVRYGNLVGSLTGMMNAYAKTVEAATSKAMEAVAESAMPVDIASRKMENYLQQVLEYFQTENECLGRLKTRLEDHTSKISSLKLELKQLAGLRMSTTTAQIEQTIESLDESVENDSNMLVAFTCDATSMVDDLINRLEAYLGALKVSKELHPIHYDLLADIHAEIKYSGICGSDRLKKYIPENTALSPIVMTEFTDTTASSVATPSPRENGKKVKKVATAAALPKLTWATLSSNPAASEIKTSFLDIQREELESKK
ncbi:hypothetical protein IV203_022357 [Nitzschia inconspicua]|uniref:Uncharacterized protein n=1 Tax=Nitzschia inconspicua TaxID=303405 RepID=A0A9K3KJU4_9STRA|nr:hypothetical protein IV203_022357 [Nitzschia inconspicua]